mmetsp:Transcript_21457/g.31429  ORF Transcript_21457/g.31429 Transcript_21457/m.31429 type:complete len:206 (-) Transcript_21457:1207-1824(-)
MRILCCQKQLFFLIDFQLHNNALISECVIDIPYNSNKMTGATTTTIKPIQHRNLCNHSRSSCMIGTNFHNWEHADSPRKKLFISEEYFGDETTVLLECELSSDILSSSQSSNLKTTFNVKDVVCRDPPHDLSLSHSQEFSSFTVDDYPYLELKNTGESSADDQNRNFQPTRGGLCSQYPSTTRPCCGIDKYFEQYWDGSPVPRRL